MEDEIDESESSPTVELEDLLTLPDSWETDDNWFSNNIQNSEVSLTDNVNSPIKSLTKFPEEPTVREIEESMNDAHTVNSIDDLRPNDHAGVSVSVSGIMNWYNNNKS